LQGDPQSNDFHVNRETLTLGSLMVEGGDPTNLPDVIALHEGLIEELVAHGHFQLGTELEFLKFAPRIVRFSGKGPESRKLFHRHPFSEYSAIGNCFAPYKDSLGSEHSKIEKAKLVSALLDSSGV
jgi:hypothetical protein